MFPFLRLPQIWGKTDRYPFLDVRESVVDLNDSPSYNLYPYSSIDIVIQIMTMDTSNLKSSIENHNTK